MTPLYVPLGRQQHPHITVSNHTIPWFQTDISGHAAAQESFPNTPIHRQHQMGSPIARTATAACGQRRWVGPWENTPWGNQLRIAIRCRRCVILLPRASTASTTTTCVATARQQSAHSHTTTSLSLATAEYSHAIAGNSHVIAAHSHVIATHKYATHYTSPLHNRCQHIRTRLLHAVTTQRRHSRIHIERDGAE